MPDNYTIQVNIVGKANVDKAVKKTTSSFKDLGKSLMSIATVGASVAAAGIAIKKAFDFGKQGAAIKQTAQSFEFLLKKIGAAPDLLAQMSTAARGTVDDMTMMASVATLAAGASDELASAMANAAPELMEIAKAANKLNPTLGDTSFMFDSLARGIKRNSPFILDNLGIVIKMGEAYQDYADSIGVSVDALDAEQQKLATLNAVLKQGDNLIAQVGGNTESATDSIEQFETAIKNMSDAVKLAFAPGVSDISAWIVNLITTIPNAITALDILGDAFMQSGGDWEDYVTGVKKILEELGYEVEDLGGLLKIIDDGFIDVTSDWKLLNKIGLESVDITGAWGDALAQSEYELGLVGDAAGETGAEIEALTAIERQEIIASNALAAGLSGVLQGALEDTTEALAELNDEHGELLVALDKANRIWGENSEQVEEANAALAENEQKQKAVADALKEKTAQMLYSYAAEELATAAAADLARQMGLLSETDYAVIKTQQQLKDLFDFNADGMLSAEEAAAGYVDEILLLNEAVAAFQEQGLDFTLGMLKDKMYELKLATEESAVAFTEAFEDALDEDQEGKIMEAIAGAWEVPDVFQEQEEKLRNAIIATIENAIADLPAFDVPVTLNIIPTISFGDVGGTEGIEGIGEGMDQFASFDGGGGSKSYSGGMGFAAGGMDYSGLGSGGGDLSGMIGDMFGGMGSGEGEEGGGLDFSIAVEQSEQIAMNFENAQQAAETIRSAMEGLGESVAALEGMAEESEAMYIIIEKFAELMEPFAELLLDVKKALEKVALGLREVGEAARIAYDTVKPLADAFQQIQSKDVTITANVSGLEALARAKSMIDAIQSKTVTITINVVVNGASVGGGSSSLGLGDTSASQTAKLQSAIMGGQHGADFIVPPGFTNDSFGMLVSSGEHVQVTPASKAGAGRGGNLYVTNNIFDPETASMVDADLQRIYRDRFDERMGS